MVKPLSGYILVEDRELKVGNYSIDEGDKKQDCVVGKVLKCGGSIYFRDGEYKECPVNEGDSIAYDRMAGFNIRDENKNYKLVDFNSIIAIVGEGA